MFAAVFALAVVSTAGAILASLIQTNKVTSVVRYVPQNRAELFVEQKEFSYWLLTDAREFKNTPPSSERLSEFLHSLSALRPSTSNFVGRMIGDCIGAALLATHTGATLDKRFFSLVESLTEAVIDASLHAVSTNNAFTLNSLQSMKTLGSLLPALRAYNNRQQLGAWKPGDAAGLVP